MLAKPRVGHSPPVVAKPVQRLIRTRTRERKRKYPRRLFVFPDEFLGWLVRFFSKAVKWFA